MSAGTNGATVLLTARVANLSSNYSLSANSASTDVSGLFFGPSFYGTPSGPNLTGARNPTVQASPSLITPMMTTYTYDALDDLTAVSQAGLASVNGVQVPGQPRSSVYDSLGRLTASTTPESGTAHFYYTTVGGSTCAADASAVCYKTDARNVTSTYTYDGLNRVTLVTYSDTTPQVAYVYDAGGAGANALGRLTSVTVGSGSPAESYTYDPLGRITQAKETVGGTDYPVGYGYNNDNSLASVTYPSGRTVTQSYDTIGRLATIASGGTNFLSGLSYNAAGQATGFSYGNQVQAAFTYNDHLQLATLRYSMASKPDLLNLAYDYTTGVSGNNGQIQKIHSYTAPGTEDLTKSENFTYDPWSRLSTASTTDTSVDPTFALSWNYDRFGNMLNQNMTRGHCTPPLCPYQPQLTVDPNTNRISTSGYAYDAAGNMTNDLLNTYAYDAENRITQVGAGAALYTYLGALRVQKTVGGTTTVYVYSGTKPIAEYAAGAQVTQPNKEYIYAGTNLVAAVSSTGTVYSHADHLSIRAQTDATGQLVRSVGHFPFGESWYVNLSNGGQSDKWQFTTYERDSESQLDYANFRYYSSRLGRFMQADLLSGSTVNQESLSRYSYVGNDPVNAVDPLGLDLGLICHFEPRKDGTYEITNCWWVDFGGGGGVGGGGGGGGGVAAKINQRAKQLRDLLAKDADCLAFLKSGGQDPLEYLDKAIADGKFGSADLGATATEAPDRASAKLDMANAQTPGVNGQWTTFNTQGAFFHDTYTFGKYVFNMTENGRQFQGGKAPAQLFLMLHEVAHGVNASGIVPDNGSSTFSTQNDNAIAEHCKQTVEAMGKVK